MNKRLRFEVFKRDGFQCAYCGKTPPEVTLEVDHIEPVSAGGTDDINNLLTACFDCNRGKTNIPLDKIPNKLSENLEILKEKEEQLREYREFLLEVETRIQNDIFLVEKVFELNYPRNCLTEKFQQVSIRKFVELLPILVVLNAINMACLKFHSDISNEFNDENINNSIRYFCGICWKRIKSGEN